MNFECDQCGACCKTFPIYVSDKDAEREPRIKKEGLLLKEWVGDETWRYQLRPLPFLEGCCFLAENNSCKIYETRPDVCRKFEAGSEQCQQARVGIGLQPLLAK